MSTTSHQGLLALSITLLVLSAISIALRFYSRSFQKVPLKIDDWIMILCLLGLAGTTGTVFYGIQKQIIGYPTPTNLKLVAETAATATKIYLAFDFCSIFTLGCVKISALFFYYRVCCTSGRHDIFRTLVIVTVVLCCLWIVAFTILVGLSCGTHFSALWSSKAAYLKYCGQTPHRFLLSLSISDFILDLWIICLPIPQILKIKTTLSRRLAIMAVFLLAFVGFGACIARLAVFVQLNNIPATQKVDSRLENTKSFFLSVLEVGLSCIAVNLPTLYYLTYKVKPENVLRSVRSTISLRSIGSRESQKSKPYSKSKGSKEPSVTSPSSSNLRPDDTIAIESHAMYDLENACHVSSISDDVHVTKTLSQSSQKV